MPEQTEIQENPPELDGCPDMSALIYLEEPNVIHNLKIRFERQTVYTRIAKILISINPYEWLPIYSNDNIKRYEENSLLDVPDSSIDPHCYNMAAIAYNDMNSESKSQSLIVCGESGSGKTESAKALMSFLAKTKTESDSSENLSEAVLAVNPILEAFGNAKTVMNNNSSRFGKFTKMIFTDYDTQNKSKTSRLVGSVINSYLLEKSRVILQSQGERNFHIFFQLYEGVGQNKIYDFSDLADFYYLNQTENHSNFHKVDGQDDLLNFTEMSDALASINLQEDMIESLFSAVISILHLGNVNFEVESNGQKTTVRSDSQKHLEKVAQLLQIEQDSLRQKLTEKTIKVLSEVVKSPFSEEEAVDNRNSMAKSLYEEVFAWIVEKCNKELLLVKDYEKLRFIGILDVFGFECFERNSFEQFCINFANERLQQLFSESLMLSEQKEYIKEGIVWTPLKIPDNRSIMRLIGKVPSGVFSQLEAACNMPKGSPEVFVRNVFKDNAKSKRISRVKPSKSILRTLKKDERFCGFKIKHYADSVVYNCNEFLAKNTDRVSEEIYELFSTSDSLILKEIFSEKKKKGGSTNNIGFVFTKELDSLIKTLKKTSNFFVRCVNPNKNKSSTEFDIKHVTKQLRSGGLVQVLKVIKLGYPTRAKYETLKNYKTKIATHPILEDLTEKDYWRAILAAFNTDTDKFTFGLTKIFFKPNINFIASIKNFDGNLTEEMIAKIRTLFVRQRLQKIKGLIFTYFRVAAKVDTKKILRLFSSAVVTNTAIKTSLTTVREKIRKEKEEAEKERKRQEQLRLEQERREKQIEEEKRRAEEMAINQQRLLEEKEQRMREEEKKAQELQQKKIEEIREKERLIQLKEKEEILRIEEKQKRKMEEMKENLAKKREEEYAEMTRIKEEFESEHEEQKKRKREEIEALEKKIVVLKEEAQVVFAKTAEEKENQIEKEREYEKKVREKLEREREEALKKIFEESKQKSDEMSTKLSQIEQQKRDEIEHLFAENEKHMERRKEEIDLYEKESKKRIKLFSEENIEHFEQMKKFSQENQNKMKLMLDEKTEQIEIKNKELEKLKTDQEKEHQEKMEEISFLREKEMSDLKHFKEITENELEYKKRELENEKDNAIKLEKMFKEQLEELAKKKKSLRSKESRLKRKELSNKSRSLEKYQKELLATKNFCEEKSSIIEKTNLILAEFCDSESILLSLKTKSRKDMDESVSEALNTTKNQSEILLETAKNTKNLKNLEAIHKSLEIQQKSIQKIDKNFEMAQIQNVLRILEENKTAIRKLN